MSTVWKNPCRVKNKITLLGKMFGRQWENWIIRHETLQWVSYARGTAHATRQANVPRQADASKQAYAVRQYDVTRQYDDFRQNDFTTQADFLYVFISFVYSFFLLFFPFFGSGFFHLFELLFPPCEIFP